jgi:hypothetical protein
VIGCLYKGIITRELISPLSSTIPYERIEELTDFKLLVLPSYRTEGRDDGMMASIVNASSSQGSENASYFTKGLFMFSSFGEQLSGEL